MYIIKFVQSTTLIDPSTLLMDASAALSAAPRNAAIYKAEDFMATEKANNKQREIRLLERALSCTAIKKMYDEATNTPSGGKTGEYKIQLFLDDGILFRAEIQPGERVIRINASLSDDEVISSFVFELTNALSQPRYAELQRTAREGPCKEYAKETERIEHEGQFLHHQVMQAAMSEMGWGAHLDIYANAGSFEEYRKQNKGGPHVELYKNQWRELSGLE